jgi:uncharacterized protein (TIGR00369 family)
MTHLPDSLATAAALDPSLDELLHHCFACGSANPEGLHLHFTADPAAHTVTAQVQLTRLHEGPPGHIHGGIVATLLDEAMSKLNRPLNVLAMTRHMEIDYLRPAPLHQPLILTGRHLHRTGRKLFHQAELAAQDGTILARAKGLFIAIDAKLAQAAKLAQGAKPIQAVAPPTPPL